MQNDVMTVRTVPEASYGQPEEHLRRVVQAVNALQNGQGNNHFSVTVDADQTTSTVIVINATFQSVVSLSPMSSAAATELATGDVWAEAKSGQIIIHHPSSPGTTRKYGVVING